MSLFDNIGGNLLDLFMDNERQADTTSMAQRAEVDEQDFGKVLALGLPALLQGINRNNRDPQGLESFSHALDQHQDVNQYNSFGELVNQVDPNEGDKILGHVFNNQQGIYDRISDTSGVNSSSVKRVLTVLAPIVLKYLASRKQTNRLDNFGVQQETGNITDQMTRSIREYGQNRGSNHSSSDALGSIFDSLTRGQANNTVKKDNESDGILDNILDLFK